MLHLGAIRKLMTHRMPRDRQRGNSLLLALIVMSALATLGSLTVVTVQSSLKSSTNDRFQAVALYAAESGAAAAMVYLRQVHASTSSFASATGPTPPVFGNNVPPGAGSPFSNDQNASYSVAILPAAINPNDHVIIRSTGFGGQGSTAILEWEVSWDFAWEPRWTTDWINTWNAAHWPVGPFAPVPVAPPAPPTNHAVILLGWREVNL